MTTVGYGGFLLGPILVGVLAEVDNFHMALGTVAIVGISIAALAGTYGERQPPGEPKSRRRRREIIEVGVSATADG